MRSKLALAVMAIVLVSLSVVVVARSDRSSASAAAAVPAAMSYDRVILVAGTGRLEMDVQGRYRLSAPMSIGVDLGFVDARTFVHNRALGPAPLSSMNGTAMRHLIGKRLTVIAEVEVKLDSEEVYVPVHARHVTFLHGTHVPEQ